MTQTITQNGNNSLIKKDNKIIVSNKNKEITPLCINCNGYYHIQSDPINAYDGIGIICDICGKNKDDDPQLLLEEYYYKCASCNNIDICTKCYKNEKEKLKITKSDDN